jgi:hypothetical protein
MTSLASGGCVLQNASLWGSPELGRIKFCPSCILLQDLLLLNSELYEFLALLKFLLCFFVTNFSMLVLIASLLLLVYILKVLLRTEKPKITKVKKQRAVDPGKVWEASSSQREMNLEQRKQFMLQEAKKSV